MGCHNFSKKNLHIQLETNTVKDYTKCNNFYTLKKFIRPQMKNNQSANIQANQKIFDNDCTSTRLFK